MEEPAIAIASEEEEEQPNQQQSTAQMEEERAESLAMEVEDDDDGTEEAMQTELEEEEGKRIEPEVDEEEDDDDFGDFEEAAAPPKPPEADPQERLEPGEEQASTSAGHVQQQPQTLASPPQVFRKSIAQLEGEPIWRCPDEEEQATFSSRSMPSPVDLFAQMDAGSSADTRQLDELEPTMLKAYQLWLLLCYVEETRALQFKWDQSQTYRRLLWALHLQKGQRRTKKFPARSLEKRAEEGRASGQHVNKQEQNQQQQNSSERQRSGSPSAGRSRTTPAPQIDSLMVPPADFDWRQSGLANPLKGQTVSAASAFDCSLLLADTRSGTGLGTMNSTSILEKELAALGLMDNDGSKPAVRVQNGNTTVLSVLDVVKLHQHQQQKQQAGDMPGNVAGVN